MSNKQKALLKKKAKRAEHNKQVAAKRTAENIANRKQQKQIATVNEFSKGFIRDCLNIIQYRQQFISDIKGHVAHVAKLKEEDPVKYQNLSTDAFTAILTKCEETKTQFDSLAEIAAKLEDASTAQERMNIVMQNLETLADAQAVIMDMAASIQNADKDFTAMINGEKPVPTAALDTKDTTEFEGDEPTSVEATEERSMEDGEIDVPEEDAKKLGS
jgi:hypothetical protein